MRLDKLTQKASEALNQSQVLASDRGHAELTPEHLLLEIFRQKDGIGPMLLSRIGLGEQSVVSLFEKELERQPRIEGELEIRPSQRLVRMLQQGESLMSKRGDQYLSTEHLIQAYLADKNQTLAGELIRMGLTPEVLEQAIDQLRGGQPINSENPEGTMEALSKYATNLTEAAR